MRRLSPILLLAGLLLALLLPSAASAAPIVGISENGPSLFADPLFQQLEAKHVRVVVSYDVMTRGDDELPRVTTYLAAAKAAGVEPLVSFEHSRGAADSCKTNRTKRQCKLPTLASYTRHFKLFRARFPDVKVYSPWNEVNHFTQGTSRNPRRAAQFTDAARANCRGCTIVAVDILDQADSAKAKKPTFKATTAYIKEFRRYLKAPRSICGIHNYSDTNRFRSTGTRAIIKALGCRQIWLTETGGIAAFASFRFDLQRQLRATRYMFSVANALPIIGRVYVYTWFGGVTPRFDAGLVEDGKARPAYAEVKRRI